MRKNDEIVLERKISRSGGSWVISLPKEIWKRIGLDPGKKAQIIITEKSILILRKGITYDDLVKTALEKNWRILYSEPGENWLFSAEYQGVNIVAAKEPKSKLANIIVSKKIEIGKSDELTAIKNIAEKYGFKITFEDPELKLSLLDPIKAEEEARKRLESGKKIRVILSKKLTSNDTLDQLLRTITIMERIEDILSLALNAKTPITKILAMLNY